MKSRIIFYVLSLTLLSSSPAFSQGSCSINSQLEKFYRLDLSVPATFCRGNTSDPSCKQFPKASLIQLHGLWPNYLNGYPEGNCDEGTCQVIAGSKAKFCGFPEPRGLYDSTVWHQLSEYMAGTEKCLERHEWIKHGTCSTMSDSPVEYFKWSLEEVKRINEGLHLSMDIAISRSDLEGRVQMHLPDLVGSLRLQCAGRYLKGIAVFYAWSERSPGRPIKTRSGNTSFGSCGNTFIVPSDPAKMKANTQKTKPSLG